MPSRQSAAEEGAARFESVKQPKGVYYWAGIRGPKDAAISEALLRSPENLFEVVAGYPVTYVLLDGVYTAIAHRGQGLACGLVRLLLEHASRQDWHVFCRPLPHGRGKASREKLFAYYRRLGWDVDPYGLLNEDWLVWHPPLPVKWPQAAQIG